MSFGQWYEEQQQDGTGSSSSGISSFSSLFISDDGDGESLPLFTNADGTSMLSLSSVRSSLESQLPSKVMGMSYQQRFKMFTTLLGLSALFFALGFFVGLPLITVRPQKFALCFSFGSLLFMSSFAILRGPSAHLQHMLSMDRLPFTTVYLGSMFGTLYYTFNTGGVSGYITVLTASGLQLLALLWYLITFLPGGASGMKVLTKGIMTILKPILLGCAKVWTLIVRKCLGRFFSE